MGLADRRAHALKCCLCVRLCSGGKIRQLLGAELIVTFVLLRISRLSARTLTKKRMGKI